MEEDPSISIEEDTLIYPRIENIYSDANIKTEPIDIDEDEYDFIEIGESSSDYYMPIPNKIILGSKPSTQVQSEPVPGPSTASDNWEDQENIFNCTECNLLFPRKNELEDHKLTCQSFLVVRPMSRAIKTERRISVSSTNSRSFLEDTSSREETGRRQKAVKSTAKSALNKTFPILPNALKSASNNPYGDINPIVISPKKDTADKGDGLLCKHCDVTFPDEISLIKHTYELLPATKFECEFCQMTFDTKLGWRGHRAKHFKKTANNVPSKDSETLLQCQYCTCFLMYPGFMRTHLMKNHKVTEFAVKHVKFSGKCAFCMKSLKSHKLYNKHLFKYHRKIFMSRTPYRFDVDAVKMKCMLCSQIFTSRHSAYKHKAEKHPDHSQKHTFHTVYDKPIKALPANPQTFKLKLVTSKNLPGNKSYIPKQNIFKCNKCQIHFVSCSAAFAHSKRCLLAKGDWKCNKCRRTFTKVEKSLHTEQHQFSEKFKVHIVCDKILSKILCRCPKCELLFDEITFRDHISTDCIPKSGIECNCCDLKIHPDSYAKHRRYHSKYNFSCGDFIVIDFVDSSFQNPPNKEMKKEQFKQVLLYCTTCTCHLYKIKSKLKYHMERKCETLFKRICTICGLNFSRKLYWKHMKHDHDTLKLKLDDIKFVRVQNSQVIKPVMPDFFQCNQCKIQCILPISKNSHNCTKEVFVKCPKCLKKYDPVTYDIHLTYHNYGNSKSQDKTSSIQLKFFSCVACNYGFHSYDSVVEHCQKHYTNSAELVTKRCTMCKLSYPDPHKVSHTNFDILKFDYEKLLTNNWLEGFGTVPKDVVEDILSKSVYGAMRNVSLELLVEGPAERTLYKCARCELNFDQDYVVDHITESCSSIPRFDCSSCTAAFKTRHARNNHMNVHVIYGDDITFREIVFNRESEKELNEALRTGRQKESLKFRKCQQCKLLIKKSDYQAHVSAHDTRVEIEQFSFRRTNKRLTYKVYKPVSATKKLYTIYKCKLCNACIMKKPNISRHKCGPADRYEKCNKCSLYFLPCNLKRHVEQHALVTKFIPKNISVQEFELLNNRENLVKKRRRYSSDDDASTGAGVTVSVSKKYSTRKVTGRPYSDHLSEDSQDNILDDSSLETSKTSNVYAKKYNKKSIEKVKPESESEESQDKIECSPGKKRYLTESILDIEKWKIDMKNKLYQCKCCYLCFPHKHLLLSHLSECADNNLLETPLICDRCDIVFHPSLLSFHEKLHELVRQNPVENYIYLISISTNGYDINNEQRWLYKCKLCIVHYLNIRSLDRHFSGDHVVPEYVNCEVCDLEFTKISRTKHMRIHHDEGNWSRKDFHIETTQKKIVAEGDFHLTAFVKSCTPNRESGVEIREIAENDNRSVDDIKEREDSRDISKIADISSKHFYDNSNSIISPKFLHEQEGVNSMDFSVAQDEIDHNLYKCDKCSKNFLSKITLLRHNMDANHRGKSFRCDLCGLFFGKRTLVIHKKVQHEQLKLGREDFALNNLRLNENDNTIEKKVVESDLLSSLQENTPVKVRLSRSGRKPKNRLSKELKAISSKLKSGVSGPIDNHIYKCVECSVYYTNRRTLLLHIVIRKHKQTEFLRCDICGLLFGKGSLQKHKIVQHEKLNLTRKDFIITDVFGSILPDDEEDVQNSIKYASSIDTDDLPLIEFEDKEKLDNRGVDNVEESNHKEIYNEEDLVNIETLGYRFKNKTHIKMFRLYQCKDCRICIKKNETKLHVCCSDIQKKQCIQCCLFFRNTDVTRHKRLHRKYDELSRKNFMLIRFGHRKGKNHEIYKCVSCSTHFVTLNALEWHMNTLSHQTKREYCKKCGLFFGRYSLNRHIYIHHKKLNLTVQQFNIIYVSDIDKNQPNTESKEKEEIDSNNSINTTVSDPEAITNIKTIKKLFRCVECDVYFLTRASYYHHIYKHKNLVATEYIDCNICDLQFLNESLGVHMKTHKDKSFCLDKLLIEEYQPNNTDSLKIELYFANDNDNSKQVSTTTLFDNEDETVVRRIDEQLSVIDSTSGELPQANAGETMNINADSYPLNSVPRLEEGTSDSVAALPNLDASVTENVYLDDKTI